MKITYNDPKFRELEKNPPIGAQACFCRFAAQCYYTVYNRLASYVSVPRKRGQGNYWKLTSSGYGCYPYFGSKNITHHDSYIEIPD